MVLFGILFLAGIAYRKRAEVYKRFMLLATTALLFAPAARISVERLLVLLLVWLFPRSWP
jgi:hypothetical protein